MPRAETLTLPFEEALVLALQAISYAPRDRRGLRLAAGNLVWNSQLGMPISARVRVERQVYNLALDLLAARGEVGDEV